MAAVFVEVKAASDGVPGTVNVFAHVKAATVLDEDEVSVKVVAATVAVEVRVMVLVGRTVVVAGGLFHRSQD
jgi:hypothetical protein